MKRIEKIFSFWQSKEPSLQAMMLRADAEQIEQEERAEIISYLPPLKGKKILELGAGIGRFTSFFASEAAEVCTVDLIPSFIEKNKVINAHFSNIDYLCSDVMELSFSPSAFDFIFINHLLMYLEDEEVKRLAQNLATWLTSGGMLFFRESCSAAGKHFCDDYYVHYRSLFFYTELFNQKLSLLKQDSLKLFEERFANPFQCFWLYVS